ncbi:MAG: [FeFe] hydrogenase H-cluster radical SAM maturase HydE [Phycisphaerae bacterium]|nr:[FeFe] hydrogenase H-cluster radical SAM maturase HydE [Phycisphaerae bacterium]
MTTREIISWLKETDETSLESLWRAADEVRQANVGDQVHLRGLIEISSYCVRSCRYCGLNAASPADRYRMTADEIQDAARAAHDYGYGSVVLQGGEDYGLKSQWIADRIRAIKAETSLAVTLSLGERSNEDFALWRDAGADRYLLRFETSNRPLYDNIHPPLAGKYSDRQDILLHLRQLGYEIGSGVMIGIPGQTWDILANDLETFARLDLDMIGMGPYIAHPGTPLGKGENLIEVPADQQVPNDELTTYKAIALTRLLCPASNIPSTTALATLNLAEGRELGLSRGANVVMPNMTPVQYRAMYEIYPAKACLNETAKECHHCMNNRIRSIGRIPGEGRGDSPNYTNNHNS